MTGSFLETEPDAIGVLVLEEFACFQAVRFIEFISRSKEIPRQYLRWQDSSRKPEEGFYSHYGRCGISAQGMSIDLHLFDLPASLLPDFNLSDLIFPSKSGGAYYLPTKK